MTLSFLTRYVAPLPGVVSVDGSALPTAAMQVVIFLHDFELHSSFSLSIHSLNLSLFGL